MGPAEPADAKVRAAVKAGTVRAITSEEQVQAALSAGVITQDEFDALGRYESVRRACIMVDDFPRDIGRSVGAAPANVVPFQDLSPARKTA
jgi:hypothetical protein